ncbi:MAG: 4'-phosphopantetheinyl transferase superfamily protein [Chloroflexota bacterium]
MKSPTMLWTAPAAPPVLRRHEVHVWRVNLDQSNEYVRSLQQMLAPDELDRANRFHQEQDRRRFIMARGVLRLILSTALAVEPDRLRFCYNPYGKPALIAEPGHEPLDFNLAHSRHLALYAVAWNRPVGVDLEYIHQDFTCEQIAEQFFSPREQAALKAITQPAAKCRAFFNGWTRKEAYLKARGAGLSLPLDRFSVSLAPGEPPRLLDHRDDPAECSRWSLVELTVDPGFAATLAVGGHGWQLACWELTYEMEIRRLYGNYLC